MQRSGDIFALRTMVLVCATRIYYMATRDSANVQKCTGQSQQQIIRSECQLVPGLRYPRLLVTPATFHISFNPFSTQNHMLFP